MSLELNANDVVAQINGIIQRVQAIHPKLNRELRGAMIDEANDIVADSKANYVPVDSGDLKDSLTVDALGSNQFQSQIRFHASGAYAIAVHEVHSEHDPPTWRGVDVQFRRGGPKYLEIPVKNAINNGMHERIADALDVGKQ